MERLKTALPMLLELRTQGIGLSVDDFGTGHSSLADLFTLSIDSLEADRSSCATGARVPRNRPSCAPSCTWATRRARGRVIAEGIETHSRSGQLRDMGCQLRQGFHMSHPLMPDAVDALLAQWLADAPAMQAPTASVCTDGA